MTAKEALREIIEGWTEEEAHKWLCAIQPTRIPSEHPHRLLTATELLRLPPGERGAIIQAQLALMSQEDIDLIEAEVEEWERGTAGDIDHIDD